MNHNRAVSNDNSIKHLNKFIEITICILLFSKPKADFFDKWSQAFQFSQGLFFHFNFNLQMKELYNLIASIIVYSISFPVFW